MNLAELILMGVALAMDAFAVSVCRGLAMRRVNIRHCLIIAAFFGGFQALMPFLGWLLGGTFAKYITSIDHWIAFFLLLYIGVKMMIDAIRERNEGLTAEELEPDASLDLKDLFLMAIATSIDALAVGITFSFLQVNIAEASFVIGIVTFGICVAGVFIGNIFGTRFKTLAQLAGGVILILLGIRILVEGLLQG